MTLKSFVEVSPESHFPIQNLPYGIFSADGKGPRIGVAIGDLVLDLKALVNAGHLKGEYLKANTLNPFIEQGKNVWSKVRRKLQDLLSAESSELQENASLRDEVLIPQNSVTMHLPVSIGDYTDFYSSREHATNVGSMFRDPDNALLPNWLHVPVAYHGRASSVVISGTPIKRPCGQQLLPDSELPSFLPSRLMDFELEMGCIIGKENPLGSPVSVGGADQHVFGLVLVNDWSARDIQKWEYVPLGPFLAKNFATSISPWVIPLEALSEFKVDGPAQDNPEPLPYLKTSGPHSYDIQLQVELLPADQTESIIIAETNYKYMYWNINQQIAHHSSNGCNLGIGDLLASGTISGPTPESYGSMLELTWKGTKPIKLPDGSERKFLANHDAVRMTGWGQGDGYRIGFGEVTGEILPADVDESLLVER